ncbi:MAG: DNA topoisomerase IV subunit B [Archaeoglobales archaeon]|nr:MAG: DNA topoisomerase IV subunit B [Archaeoglobales archaeon]
MEYTSETIEVLDDIQAVRKRPGMYVGNTGLRGFHHLLWEIVDNSVDEALAGFCTEIVVRIHEDGSASVEDNGRGIPVEEHPTFKRSALEIVMTKLHSGGKFSKKAYKVSGGLHGVGLSVVNALSEWLEVWVKRNGKIYHQRYERGRAVKQLEVVGESNETGTKIAFKPDPEIFEVTEFDYDLISERLRELAFLNRCLKIKLIDERKRRSETFYSEDGILGFLNYLNRGKDVISDVIYVCGERDGIFVEVAFQFTNEEFERLLAFANSIHTVEGTHVSGFRSGLTRAINEYGKRKIKKFKPISGVDVREGLTAVLSVKVPDPQFEGQTKAKLTNTEVRRIVDSLTYREFLRWLEENPNYAQRIVEKCILSMKAREMARRTKEIAKKRHLTLPGKLADCTVRGELFIVEGESAGGSAKQARDRRFQAVLPIRGKIINVEKSGILRALKNDEIKSIASAIGGGIGGDFDISKVRYKRIIIMTDADVDGAHIRTLLLTFFYRYMRPLIEHGRIYIALPPLYRVKKDGRIYYVYSERELRDLIERIGKAEVQRFKGLGEMNPNQLWETTMNPRSRKLVRVTIEDALMAEKMFRILMGEDVEARKEFIMSHARYVRNLDV